MELCNQVCVQWEGPQIRRTSATPRKASATSTPFQWAVPAVMPHLQNITLVEESEVRTGIPLTQTGACHGSGVVRSEQRMLVGDNGDSILRCISMTLK